MKVNICYNIKMMKPLFFIFYQSENELIEIEEEHPIFAFFTTDPDEIETSILPFYTVSQFKKLYNI